MSTANANAEKLLHFKQNFTGRIPFQNQRSDFQTQCIYDVVEAISVPLRNLPYSWEIVRCLKNVREEVVKSPFDNI